MKQSQRILKNAASGLAGQIVGGGLNVLIPVIIARQLGVERFGSFAFVIAFSSVFQLLADFGISNILVKQMAISRDTLSEILGAARSLIWVFSVVIGLVMVGVILVLRVPAEVKWCLVVMDLAVLIQFHSAGYTAVFRALEEMEYNALGYALHKILLLGLVVGLVWAGGELQAIIWAHLLANVGVLGFYVVLIRRRFRFKLRIDLSAWKATVLEALPLGAAMILRQSSRYAETLILAWLATLGAVGLFSGANRLVQALNLLPFVLSIPLYPVFARIAQFSREEFSSALERSMKVFVYISLPVAVVFLVLGRPIVVMLLGDEYAGSGIVLQILSLTVIPIFLSGLFPYVFTALGSQTAYLWATGAAMALRIVLNFLLIPSYGIVGASIASVVGEVSITVFGVWLLARAGARIRWKAWVWRSTAAGVLMGMVLFGVRGAAFPLMALGMLVGGVVYVGGLFLLKGFSPDEIRWFREGISALRSPGVAKARNVS